MRVKMSLILGSLEKRLDIIEKSQQDLGNCQENNTSKVNELENELDKMKNVTDIGKFGNRLAKIENSQQRCDNSHENNKAKANELQIELDKMKNETDIKQIENRLENIEKSFTDSNIYTLNGIEKEIEDMKNETNAVFQLAETTQAMLEEVEKSQQFISDSYDSNELKFDKIESDISNMKKDTDTAVKLAKDTKVMLARNNNKAATDIRRSDNENRISAGRNQRNAGQGPVLGVPTNAGRGP